MPDCHFLGRLPPFFRKAIKHLRNQPHAFLEFAFALAEEVNAGTFLTAVLKCEKAETRNGGGIGMIRNTEYSTSFLEHK
jgi:hypothetical protein